MRASPMEARLNITLNPAYGQEEEQGLARAKAGCIVVGIFEGGVLSLQAQALDADGALSLAIESGDISGKPGTTLMLRQPSGTAAR